MDSDWVALEIIDFLLYLSLFCFFSLLEKLALFWDPLTPLLPPPQPPLPTLPPFYLSKAWTVHPGQGSAGASSPGLPETFPTAFPPALRTRGHPEIHTPESGRGSSKKKIGGEWNRSFALPESFAQTSYTLQSPRTVSSFDLFFFFSLKENKHPQGKKKFKLHAPANGRSGSGRGREEWDRRG